VQSTRPGEASFLASTAVKDHYGIIAAVGGDGTVNEVARTLSGTETILAIIPGGSGNGLARHLGLPMETESAIRVIASMKTRLIDTAYLNGRKFFSIAGIGFDARVANKYRKVMKRGFFTYLRISLFEFFSYKERDYEIIADGVPLKRKALFITIANSNQFGYNTVIAPKAEVDDGWLDLVVAKKWPLTETPRVVTLVYTNKIDHSPYIEVIRAREIIVTRKKGKRVNLDGEAVKVGKVVKAWIVPADLKVIVP
jgi:YegS/Rv2252/BmrU family lipid kinase